MSRRLAVAASLALLVTLVAPVEAASTPTSDPAPQIIGGSTVPAAKYPFVVALQLGLTQCGGSVISPTWVLTAAHCVTDTFGVEDVLPADSDVIIGRYDLTTGDGVTIVASDILVHPLWDGEGDDLFEYDFALIELSSATAATPIQLATVADVGLYDAGDPATVMGWGWTLPGSGPSSLILKEVDIPIISDADCSVPWILDPASEVCGGTDTEDACVGDSGGPLVAPPGTSGWKLIGVVSSGPLPCATAIPPYAPGEGPGIYSEVAAAIPWILSVGAINPPVAVADGGVGFTTAEETPFTTANVTANDTDVEDGTPNASTTTITVGLTPPTAGILVNKGNGTFDFAPTLDFAGAASFSYTVDDSTGATSNPAIVTITVTPTPDDPVANSQAATTAPGIPTVLTLTGSDADGESLTFSIISGPTHGALGALAPSPPHSATLTYTATGGYLGPDSFSFMVDDGTGGTDTAIVSLTVSAPEWTSGLVDVTAGKWYLRNSIGAITSFFYGNPGDLPISGDWDGNGTSTPGLYRQSDGFFYARNANSVGIGDASCFAGDPSDVPIVGDWDGDGDDNLGLYRPSEQRFYLFTTECTGSPMGTAQISLGFGNPGDKPVSGDWDGDGITEIGLHRESTGLFYWRNTLTTGNAIGAIFFGDPDDRFIAGDWGIVDSSATPAIFRPGDRGYYFRHTLTEGPADSQFTWTGAGAGWLPVSGTFGLG
ncbi:MAG: trypsin-like serine protease [Acidimicrobiia bacterium]